MCTGHPTNDSTPTVECTDSLNPLEKSSSPGAQRKTNLSLLWEEHDPVISVKHLPRVTDNIINAPTMLPGGEITTYKVFLFSGLSDQFPHRTHAF